MASSLEFVQYVCDQLADTGVITFKRMFGEFGIYCDGKYFAVVCDSRFLVKITEAGRALMPACREEEPYPGGSPMFLMENLDDRTFLAQVVRVTCDALPPPKPKRTRGKPQKAAEQ